MIKFIIIISIVSILFPIVSAEAMKVAFVTDALFSDEGWGTAGYNASESLKNKYNLELTQIESVLIPEIELTLRDMGESGKELIIAQGFEWGDPAIKVSKDYPNTKFVVFTGLVNSTNVASIFPMQQEGSYLLGALAAMMSKTGVIGFVGGDSSYPNIINIMEGYEKGAKDINPGMNVMVRHIQDFDNPVKGRNSANDLIDSRADVLFHVADLSGQGVIQAAKERGVHALGIVSDQDKLAPETILTSLLLDMEKSFDQSIKSVQTGNFSGQIFKPGLEMNKDSGGDGIVYLAELDDQVPKEVKDRIEQLKRDIIEGRLVVPEDYDPE